MKALILILIFSLFSAFADTTMWPGWLGPERNGFVKDFQVPKKWPAKLKKKWSVEVGSGYGTPIVSGEYIYQHARQGEQEVLWCVKLSSGETIWKQSFDVKFKVGNGGESHGKGPKACPYLADGRLFTLSINGVLRAWDAQTGKPLWVCKYANKFKKPNPFWGATTSPLVDGGRIFVHFGSCDEGAMVAIDVKTGKILWERGPDGASYSSPFIVELSGVRHLVEWNHVGLVGVELETGEALWHYPMPHLTHNQNMPTPTYHKDKIYVGGENRGVRGLKPYINDGKWTVDVLWHQRRVALDMNSAIINDDLLFGFSHFKRGQLFCMDPNDGQILWRGPALMGSNATFLSVPGHVLILKDGGDLRIFKTNREKLETVAEYSVADSPTWAPPVLLKNALLIKSKTKLIYWSFN